MCTRNHNHMMFDVRFLSETDRIFCHFGSFYALSPPQTTQKIKILKNLKKDTDVIILHVYKKSQSYDVCFLGY